MSDRALEDERLLVLIRDSYTASGKVYGSPRVFGDLREAGEQCGKQSGGPADASPSDQGCPRLQGSQAYCRQAIHRLTQPLEAGIHSSGARSGLGNGYYLYPHLAGLAVPGGNRGSVRPQGGRVVHEANPGSRVGSCC